MSLITDLADAVVQSINASGILSSNAQAKRQVVPEYELQDLQQFRVFAVPVSTTISVESRDTSRYELSIDVGLVQKVNPQKFDEEVAQCGILIDRLSQHLQRRELPNMPQAQWLAIENGPIFDYQKLQTQSVYMGVLTVTYALFM